MFEGNKMVQYLYQQYAYRFCLSPVVSDHSWEKSNEEKVWPIQFSQEQCYRHREHPGSAGKKVGSLVPQDLRHYMCKCKLTSILSRKTRNPAQSCNYSISQSCGSSAMNKSCIHSGGVLIAVHIKHQNGVKYMLSVTLTVAWLQTEQFDYLRNYFYFRICCHNSLYSLYKIIPISGNMWAELWTLFISEIKTCSSLQEGCSITNKHCLQPCWSRKAY